MSLRVSLFIALSLFAFVCCTADSYDNYLWNLDTDPYENENLYYSSEHQATVSLLSSALFEVINNNDISITCDNSDKASSDEEEAYYEACGGVCPYVDNTSQLTIEQKYFPENAPNIVFMLVDDWGYNDVGYQSTYMSWTTPNIDRLVTEGITMSNYFTHYFCTPSRGALMTGRTANRLGLIARTGTDSECELPLSEVTIANEMKSAGYKTYMVGKWHLGSTSFARTPTYRGFDSFYGYYTGFIEYYTKWNDYDYLDLQDGTNVETDPDALDTSMHSAYIFQTKAEAVIQEHASSYPDTPMFLYYALQLIHFPFAAPSTYSDRCDSSLVGKSAATMCGLNLMLDEVIANTTCVLETTGLIDNTIVVVASDNGGKEGLDSNMIPFRGHKYDFTRGGVTANAYIFSKLLSDSVRGTSYGGLMHVTDWLPTLMYVATEGAWTGSYSGVTLDGVNQWEAIMNNQDSPRSVIVHYADYGDTSIGSIQIDNYKLDYNISLSSYGTNEVIVEIAGDSYVSCSNPSYSDSYYSLETVRGYLTAGAKSMASAAVSLAVFDSQTFLVAASVMLVTVIAFMIIRIVKGDKYHGYQQLPDVDVTIGTIYDDDGEEF